jgi:hypothetical protein
MAYKPKQIKTTVSGALSAAFSEFQALGEEMRETADNMDAANMGHMPKCEAAAAAADELENHVDEPDVPEHLADLPVEATEMVNRDKRKGASRSVRLSNAQALVSAARDALDGFEPEGHDDDDEESETHRAAVEAKEAAEELYQELDEHAEFDVEFPGMFG